MIVLALIFGMTYVFLTVVDVLTFHQRRKIYEQRQDIFTPWLNGRLLHSYKRHWKVQAASIAMFLLIAAVFYFEEELLLGSFALLMCLSHYHLFQIAKKMKAYAEDITERAKLADELSKTEKG